MKTDTLVVELHTDRPVGIGEAGASTLKRCLLELAALIGFGDRVLSAPQTHLSEKYGFAAWIHGLMPSGEPCTVHVYVWDDRSPTFISVDLILPAGPRATSDRQIIECLRGFFSALAWTAKLQGYDNEWREIQPDIYRQRLTLAIASEGSIRAERVAQSFEILSREIHMEALSSPMMCGHGENSGYGWMHWSTSGVVASWSGNWLEMGIYTCKAFDPETARGVIERELGKIRLSHSF